MACVDAPPLVKQDSKSMIYYKKKYLFNLAGSNWNLFSSEVLDQKVKKAQERQVEIKKSASHSDIYEDMKKLEPEEKAHKSSVVEVENKKDNDIKSNKEVRRSSRSKLSSRSKGIAPKISETVGMTKQYARMVKLEPLSHA